MYTRAAVNITQLLNLSHNTSRKSNIWGCVFFLCVRVLLVSDFVNHRPPSYFCGKWNKVFLIGEPIHKINDNKQLKRREKMVTGPLKNSKNLVYSFRNNASIPLKRNKTLWRKLGAYMTSARNCRNPTTSIMHFKMSAEIHLRNILKTYLILLKEMRRTTSIKKKRNKLIFEAQREKDGRRYIM